MSEIKKYVTTEEFEDFVKAHAATALSDMDYSVLGLCGECGEVAEWHKKANHRKNAEFTPKMLLKELGDVLHYTTRIALAHGWSLEKVMRKNIKKLEKRHGTIDPKAAMTEYNQKLQESFDGQIDGGSL